MSIETGPQGELQKKAQNLDDLLETARSLSREPGGSPWPERFQLANLPPNEDYLRRAVQVGQITDGIISKGIPSLARRQEETAREITLTKDEKIPEPERNLRLIEAFVARGSLPPDALISAHESVDKLNGDSQSKKNRRSRKEREYQKMHLPYGELVIASGKLDRRILNSLVIAYNQGVSGVSNEVLLTYCISDSITGNKAQRRLNNTIYRLRTKNLKGTNWKILTYLDRANNMNAAALYSLVYEEPSNPTEKEQEELAVIDPPKQGIETTIFAANEDGNSVAPSPSEDPQDEEDDSKDIPLTTEEIRQNALKKQARLQLAVNILNAVRSGKLQTLDRNVDEYVQSSLPPGISVQDAKGFIIESIDTGLYYWNLNEWDLRPNPSAQEKGLIETCRELRTDPQTRRRYTQQGARQEILSYFNLP